MSDSEVRIHRIIFWIAVALLFACVCRAQIIPASRTIDWTQVGVRSGNMNLGRSNLIDVTQAPYGADKTGVTNATSSIQSAINAATNGQVVYIPNGRYIIGSSLFNRNSFTTLRGQSLNAILVGTNNSFNSDMLEIGFDAGNFQPNVTDTILSGSTKGSTNITLTAPFSGSLGDVIAVLESTTTLGTTNFPVIHVHQYDRLINQTVIVTAINGNTLTISDPLAWDFTNAPTVADWNFGLATTKQVGVENLTFTMTNTATGGLGNFIFGVNFSLSSDCWMSNCVVTYSYDYGLNTVSASHLTIIHNTIQYSQGGGSDHAGALLASTGGSLYADNIFANGLQPAIEFNIGFCGNAVFANFFTNNVIGIDCHNTHPMMNLWEENVTGIPGADFRMDGYFGSASHQTLFRDYIGDSYIPLSFNRWDTYMNVVGCVLGCTTPVGGTWNYYQAPYVSGFSPPAIVRIGFPNLGNQTFSGTNNAWNFPLSSYPSLDSIGNLYQSPVYTFTNNQGPTNVLVGNFTNIPPAIAGLSSLYTLVFQDASNPNLYYPTNGVFIYPTAITASNMTLNLTNVTVLNGQNLFIASQAAWQQVQTNLASTHWFAGNYDYKTLSTQWLSTNAQTIPPSLLYPNGFPAWWANAVGNTFVIDPSAPTIGMIPAQARFLGITLGGWPFPVGVAVKQ